MAREIVVVVNPTAGSGRAARVARPVAGRLRAAGRSVRVVAGADAAEAVQLVKQAVADPVDALVVVGGDGMVHLALDALAGSDVPLGVIPAGSGNDLARALSIPRRDPLAAADVVLAGRTRRIDLARASGTWYATVLATGFDALVADRAARLALPGALRYPVAVAAELRVLRSHRFVLELDGGRQELDAALIAVGNTASYGGGLRMCVGAQPDDGLLDIAVVAPVTRAQLVRAFPLLYRGRQLTHPAFSLRRARRVRIDAVGLTALADGERLGPLPLDVRCAPGALRVFAP